jgi:hypothetical protein
MNPLTGARGTLSLLKNAPQRGPQELTPFLQHLISLNEDYHLYRMERRNFEALESNLFGPLIWPGSLVFSREDGAVVLSADRRFLSVCLEVDSYRDTSQHHDWLALDPSYFESGLIRKTVTHFIESPKIYSILQCPELLSLGKRH